MQAEKTKKIKKVKKTSKVQKGKKTKKPEKANKVQNKKLRRNMRIGIAVLAILLVILGSVKIFRTDRREDRGCRTRDRRGAFDCESLFKTGNADGEDHGNCGALYGKSRSDGDG